MRRARTPVAGRVREILRNPKYTGYMVWNRRASKKGGRCNPPSEWVWSPAPTHEPLVTKALFEAAATARVRQGSRSDPGLSRHPQAARSYPLRSYIFCELCGRRMFGKTRHDLAYYACEPSQRHHAQRSAWQPGQPVNYIGEGRRREHLLTLEREDEISVASVPAARQDAKIA